MSGKVNIEFCKLMKVFYMFFLLNERVLQSVLFYSKFGNSVTQKSRTEFSSTVF